ERARVEPPLGVDRDRRAALLDERAALDLAPDRRLDRLAREVERLRRLVDDGAARRADVPLARELAHDVPHARVGARGRVLRDAQPLRDAVRREDADPPDLARA